MVLGGDRGLSWERSERARSPRGRDCATRRDERTAGISVLSAVEAVRQGGGCCVRDGQDGVSAHAK